jgi:hypothetical protein
MPPRRHRGDLFALFQGDDSFDLLVVTVNAARTGPDGRPLRAGSFGPMGKGCAARAARLWPEFRAGWAAALAAAPHTRFSAWPCPGNPARFLGALVTKEVWWEPATFQGLHQSLAAMHRWLESSPARKILMPLPGAGLGGLDPLSVWDFLEDRLDAKFTVCTP